MRASVELFADGVTQVMGMDGSLSQMGMDGSILDTNVDENAPDDQEEPPNVDPGAGQQSDKPLDNHEPSQGLLNRLA